MPFSWGSCWHWPSYRSWVWSLSDNTTLFRDIFPCIFCPVSTTVSFITTPPFSSPMIYIWSLSLPKDSGVTQVTILTWWVIWPRSWIFCCCYGLIQGKNRSDCFMSVTFWSLLAFSPRFYFSRTSGSSLFSIFKANPCSYYFHLDRPSVSSTLKICLKITVITENLSLSLSGHSFSPWVKAYGTLSLSSGGKELCKET